MAPEHLPSFLPSADGSDPLFWVIVVFLIIVILCLGVFYFRLHSLPEHLAKQYNSSQLQLISVLTVLALFTHNNIFWVFALVIAVIRLPDFLTPLTRIADSLAQLAKNSGDSGRPKATTFDDESVAKRKGE